MKITKVSLIDVKSYDERSPSIQFQTGVNAIIGENGSGKSTLCEAVGFALFDFLHPYSQADFVREGKKSGRVSVTFRSDTSNDFFRVERGVGQSKFDVFRNKNNEKLALHGKEDVLAWLKDELGVPSSMDLQTLWKSSIGVPQGKFTNDFAMTPSIRAQLFNPLLEVDVYRNLWKKMKGVLDVLIQKKNQVSDQIVPLEIAVSEIPHIKQECKEKNDSITSAKKQVSKLKEKLEKTQKEKEKLESIEKKIETLSSELTVFQNQSQEKKEQINQSKEQFNEAKHAKEMINKHQKQYDEFILISDKLDDLFEKRKTQVLLEEKLVDLEKQSLSLEKDISQIESDQKIAEKSKKEMETLKDKVEKQENLEEKLKSIIEQEKEETRIHQDISQIKDKISSLRKTYRQVQQEIKRINEKKQVAKDKPSLQKKKESIQKELSVMNHQIKELHQTISLLESGNESVCPTCNRELDELHRKTLLKTKQNEINSVEEKKRKHQKKIEQILTDLEKADLAEKEVQRLTDLKEYVHTLQKEADGAKKQKQILEEKIVSIKKSVSEKELIQKELEKLDDPKNAFQLAKSRYEDRHIDTIKYRKLKEEFSSIKHKENDLSNKLEEFTDVKNRIDLLTKKQKKLKESYELYLKHKENALKVDVWKDQVKTLKESFNRLQEKISFHTEQISTLKKNFDKQVLSQLKTELEELTKQFARVEAQIKEWVKQKHILDKRLDEKLQQEKELRSLKNEISNLEKDIEFAQFLRETYQKSRPLITEILVEEISREADRIYRELRGVASEELTWKNDYEIVVYEGGNSRAFHKLSGGEKMCAALAIRLAILKLLSTLDIVFLDEPTMNLDEGKKDNLLAQLRDLSGFSQIFVISHDETFESMTEHVITLEKRNGSTQLLTHFQGGF